MQFDYSYFLISSGVAYNVPTIAYNRILAMEYTYTRNARKLILWHPGRLVLDISVLIALACSGSACAECNSIASYVMNAASVSCSDFGVMFWLVLCEWNRLCKIGLDV